LIEKKMCFSREVVGSN